MHLLGFVIEQKVKKTDPKRVSETAKLMIGVHMQQMCVLLCEFLVSLD